MSNFYQRSKDQFASDKETYSHFEDVFREIRSMSIAKNYYYTDLRNIEDILSILEFRAKIGMNKDNDKWSGSQKVESRKRRYTEKRETRKWQERIGRTTKRSSWKPFGYMKRVAKV